MTSGATRTAFAFICTFLLTLNFQGQDVSASPTTDHWGQWSDWTTCSTECGPGLQTRTRACRNDACQAESDVQSRSCQVKVCPASQPSYRQTMCTKYDIQVLSGARYEWQPYVHPTDACKLACRAKEVSFYSNLPERARDGELCHKAGEPKAVCFKGVCKPVGCDNIVMSSAREDDCGVCDGDGSDCKAVSGVFTNSQLPRGINHVISIPAGSTSINITELSPSRNHLILQGLSGKTYLDAGHGRRASVTVQAAGTTIQYVGKTSVNPRESIISKGPTNSTVYVKLLSRGSIPSIAYTFSVPIEYDTQALMSGIIQRPVIQTAPLHLKEDDVAHSAVHGGHRSVQRTDDAVRDETTTHPMPASKDTKQKETLELNELEDDLLEASGDVGVEIIDSGPGGSSVVSSYDVSIGKGGVEVLQKGYDNQEGSDDDEEDEDNFESSDNDGDDDDDDEDDNDNDDEDEYRTDGGINSSAHKPGSIGNNKHGVISRPKRPPFYRQSMEYEGTHEIDVTYFNNDYSYGSNSIPGDSNERNRDGGENTIYDATRARPEEPNPNSNERKFKMPKFSNSFTFANRFKNPVFTSKRDKDSNNDGNNGNNNNGDNNNNDIINDNTYNIRVKPGPRGYAGGYGTNALEAAPTTSRKASQYESERDRMLRERQKLLDERNERLRKRMEDYNRRLREYQERMRERRREALQRSYRLNPGRPGLREADRHDLNSNDRNRMSPTPSSVFVNPVYVDATRNADHNPSPTIIKRVSLTLETGDDTNRRIPSVFPRTRESTSTTSNTRSSSSSRVNIIPVINSEDVLSQQQNVRKIIPRIQEKDNVKVSSQTPDEIISRTSDNDPTTNSQGPRKINSRVAENQPTSIPGPATGVIIPRVSVPNVQTGPDFIPHGDSFEQVIGGPGRTVIDSSQIIRTNGQPPRYIPNERGTYTSALSGGDPNVLSSRTNGIIPNRLEASGLPESRTLATADERQPFPNNEWRISGLTECTHSCGGGVQQTVVVCVDTGTQAVVTDDNCRLVRRPAVKAVPCNKRPCPARWVPSSWSSCSVTCGDGEQTRTVNCQARVSPTLNLTMPDSSCQNSETPVQTRSCNTQPCSSWSVGNWSQCSSDCGDGFRSRDVTCIGLDQEELEDTDCSSLKPDTQEPCNLGQCGKGWFFTAWPEKCPVRCGKGVLTRKVFCASEDGEALPESRCDTNNRPQTTQPCRADTPCGGSWYTSPWSMCNVSCGLGSRLRDVLCVKTMPGNVYAVVGEENCAGSPKPDEGVTCEEEPCTPEWFTTSWGQCSASCGNGYKTREIKCLSPSQLNDDQCPIREKPKTREPCNGQSCRAVKPAGIKPSSEDESCKDKFSQCRVVKRTRLCKYSYYKKMCCRSCS